MTSTDTPANTTKFVTTASALQIGDTILEGKNKRTEVKRLDPCSKRDHVHVNKTDCYWMPATVTVVGKL